jgi:hypothetical protein
MRDELQRLIALVKPNADEGDRVIFVGDLVDKGPMSLETLRLAKWITEDWPGSVVVSGNHEEKASRQAKRGIFVEPWAEQATQADWDFIDAMPLTWYAPDLDVRVVHGGIFPALLNNHPDVFEKIEGRGNNWRKGGGKVMNRARRMLRIRYVGGEERMHTGEKPGPGDMLELGANRASDPFWADTWYGSHGFVVFGHSPWIDGEVRKFPHALGIDTGAVFGGKLTAAVFTGRGQFEIVQVDCPKFAEPLEED